MTEKNIINSLFEHSKNIPNKQAFVYHDAKKNKNITSVTFDELFKLVMKVGYNLKKIASSGDRVSLTLDNSIEYVVAFLAIQSIGAIPVSLTAPTKQDNRADRLKFVLSNCQPTVSIVDQNFNHRDVLGKNINIENLLKSENMLSIDELLVNETAFLQYTSGSTSNPKGVVISQKNLFSNHLQLKEAFNTSSDTVYGTWLPIFHDMGLIGKILHPIFDGSTVHAIRPESFLKNPKKWLEMISEFKVDISAAPNFAYDYCIDRIRDSTNLDLSSWKYALNGSEPVSLETMIKFSDKFGKNGFKFENFYPVYGLAEATLFVTSRPSKSNINILDIDLDELKNSKVVEKNNSTLVSKKIVGLGTDWGDNSKTIIWDNDKNKRCNNNEVGEIIISGNNCSIEYFRNDEANAISSLDIDLINPIRTGDLGFINNNDLYVTGRIKEIIIIRGKNIYPEDIEYTAQEVSSQLIKHGGAAFSIEMDNQQEIILVQEVVKNFKPNLEGESLSLLIREKITANFGINISNIIFITKGKLPKTTSGKLARNQTKNRFLDGFYDFDNHIYRLDNSYNKIKNMSTWIDDEFTKFDFRLFDERRCITPNVALALGNNGFLGLTASDSLSKNKKLPTIEVMNFIRKISSIDLTCAALIGIHNGLVLAPLEKYGSLLQKTKWLDLLKNGRIFGSFALTESTSGSNPRSIQSKAIRTKENTWILNGEKIWIGAAGWSDITLFFAQSYDENNNYLGVTAFLVPTNVIGFSQGDETLTMGMRGIIQNAINLKDVEIETSHVLGEVGKGFEIVESTITFARLGVAYMALGGMERSLKLICDYSSKREIVGGLLITHPVVSSKIFEISIYIKSIKYISDKISSNLDLGINVPNELLSLIKAITSELCWDSIDNTLQIFGGRGYDEANSIPQMLRDSRLLRIFEGSSEALFEFVGHCLFEDNLKLFDFLKDNFDSGSDLFDTEFNIVKNKILQNLNESDTDKPSLVRLSNYTFGLWFSYFLLKISYQNTNTSIDSKNAAKLWFSHLQQNVLAEFLIKRKQINYIKNSGINEILNNTKNDLPNWNPMASKIKNYPNIDLEAIDVVSTVISVKENSNNSNLEKNNQNIKADAFQIKKWLSNWIINRKKNLKTIDYDKSFFEFGLDSIDAAELVFSFETEFKIQIDPTVLWEFPTITKLSDYLVNKMGEMHE